MLALLEYFWVTSDWIPAPEPPAPPANEARGSGKGTGPYEYVALSEDFWSVREEYLRSQLPPEKEVLEEVIEVDEPEEITNLAVERKEAYLAAQMAENRLELEGAVSRFRELTGQIESLRSQYEEDALLVLLLSI